MSSTKKATRTTAAARFAICTWVAGAAEDVFPETTTGWDAFGALTAQHGGTFPAWVNPSRSPQQSCLEATGVAAQQVARAKAVGASIRATMPRADQSRMCARIRML